MQIKNILHQMMNQLATPEYKQLKEAIDKKFATGRWPKPQKISFT